MQALPGRDLGFMGEACCVYVDGRSEIWLVSRCGLEPWTGDVRDLEYMVKLMISRFYFWAGHL